MKMLIAFKAYSGNTMYIASQKIEAFVYNEQEKVTYVWTTGGEDNQYKFPGNYMDEIINAFES